MDKRASPVSWVSLESSEISVEAGWRFSHVNTHQLGLAGPLNGLKIVEMDLALRDT